MPESQLYFPNQSSITLLSTFPSSSFDRQRSFQPTARAKWVPFFGAAAAVSFPKPTEKAKVVVSSLAWLRDLRQRPDRLYVPGLEEDKQVES